MQDQRLTEIRFGAGVVKELQPPADTVYWADADKIRFRYGMPELMGGWQSVTDPSETVAILGQPRALETVRALTGERAAVVGTHVGLFSTNLSRYYNVTPLVTTVAGTDILSTTAGSTRIVVSVSAHGITDESVIGIVSAEVTIGGNILINAPASTSVDFQVSIIDANSFAIEVDTTAAATSVQTGGATTIYIYYPAGGESLQIQGGWGGDVWNGNFGWGSPTGANNLIGIRHWSMDTWGTELMTVPTSGPLMLYSPQNGVATRFAIVTAAPSVNQVLRVATESRHVILYGTHDIAGTYDPLLIRWSSQEDYTDWTPTSVNTAGDFRLNSDGSEIVSVVKMRDQHLIFTDADLFVQAYIGPNDVFGFSRAGRQCGIYARNAVTELAGVAYWMGNGQFYRYDGRVQPLPSTVLRYVFDNIDPLHKDKIFCGTIAQYDEVIWFYTSLDSPDGENDRYVIFNTVENHWTIGTMNRNVWKDRSVYTYILGGGPEGEGLYYQETDRSAGTSIMHSYLESKYFDVQDGNPILFCNKVVPWLNAKDNDTLVDEVTLYLKSRKYPGADTVTKGPYTVTGDTDKISTRLRGREFAIRFESDTSSAAQAWRLTSFRMALQADGLR